MPVYCNLRLLYAQLNVKRAEEKQSAISLRQLAIEAGIPQSVLLSLYHDRNKRIDYDTIDKLLSYFRNHMLINTCDLLIWEAASAEPHQVDHDNGQL